jgi:virginiamycin B lyase
VARTLSGLVACGAVSIALVCAPAAMGELGAVLSVPHGGVWFTEPAAGRIGEIAANRRIRWFHILTAHGDPAGLSAGPTGAIWFTEPKAGKIGRISAGGAISEFPVPLPPAKPPPSEPLGIGPLPRSPELPEPGVIAAGPDQNLWFTEGGGSSGVSSIYGGQIDRIAPDGTISAYQIPSPNSEPYRLVSGPDGNLWFTESTLYGGVIGRITPAGAITTFPLSESHEPGGIAAGPDGALWFTDVVFSPKRITGMIGRITTAGTIRYFPLPTPEAQPQDIATGTNGALWFTSGSPEKVRFKSKDKLPAGRFTGRIGRITPNGHIKEFAVRHPPLEITPGANNEMLFTQESTDDIGRITANGAISEIGISSRAAVLRPAHAHPHQQMTRNPRRGRARRNTHRSDPVRQPEDPRSPSAYHGNITVISRNRRLRWCVGVTSPPPRKSKTPCKQCVPVRGDERALRDSNSRPSVP